MFENHRAQENKCDWKTSTRKTSRGHQPPVPPTKKKAQRVAHQGHPTQRTDRSRYPVPVSKSEMYGSILFGSVACAVTPQRAPTWEPPAHTRVSRNLHHPAQRPELAGGSRSSYALDCALGPSTPAAYPFEPRGAVAPIDRLYSGLLTYKFIYRRGT